jgi:two-component system nitrogen regulation sensor histidine kinase GlnL
VRNAIQAGAGSITLRTRVEHGCASPSSCTRWPAPGNADDGRGVPEELAEHLFLPLVSGRAEAHRAAWHWPSRSQRASRLTYRRVRAIPTLPPIGNGAAPGRGGPAT